MLAKPLRWQFDSRDDLHDLLLLFEIRRLIEPEAAALAAARSTKANSDAIGAAYEALAASSQTQVNLIEADVAFHLAVLSAAENKYLLALGSRFPQPERLVGFHHRWGLSHG